MKLMFASDIHGSAMCLERLLERYEEEKPEKLILLGDILYHGPRNDLPEGYAPKQVIAMLNPMKKELLCVRGNCEAEVDQMVLEFPVMADYMTMWLDGRIDKFVEDRYASWKTGIGAYIISGKATMADLEKYALEKGEVVDSLSSGSQEMLESILNNIMFSL